MNDRVNSPEWYVRNGIECIDVLKETQGVDSVKSFCICNAIKYLYRHKNKNGVEDIKKAIWYLNKYISLCDDDKGDVEVVSNDDMNSKSLFQKKRELYWREMDKSRSD